MRDAEPFNFLLLLRLLLVSFALNWIWEMVQMPAFVATAGRSWRDTALTCALFSLGDAGLTLSIYGVALVAARHITKVTRAKFYLLLAALGAVVAVVVELIAKAFGSWSYSKLIGALVIALSVLIPGMPGMTMYMKPAPFASSIFFVARGSWLHLGSLAGPRLLPDGTMCLQASL